MEHTFWNVFLYYIVACDNLKAACISGSFFQTENYPFRHWEKPRKQNDKNKKASSIQLAIFKKLNNCLQSKHGLIEASSFFYFNIFQVSSTHPPKWCQTFVSPNRKEVTLWEWRREAFHVRKDKCQRGSEDTLAWGNHRISGTVFNK